MDKFMEATSDNLPKVDIFMVHELIKRDDRFNIAEVAGVKPQDTYSRQQKKLGHSRSTSKSYGDNAIGYIELKKEAELCTVGARIFPEHKVKSKAYTVNAVINEKDENIVNICCKNCIAGEDGCKHTLAFLMWLTRRSENPAATGVSSYSKKPRLSNTGTLISMYEAIKTQMESE